MAQTLTDISLIKDRQVALAIDNTAQAVSNAGIGANGTITAGVFNGTIGATTPSTAVVTTLTANTSGSLIKGIVSGSAVAAGNIGETMGDMVFGTGTTATITLTQANPGVITWTAHGFSTVIPQPVVFTTTGALPTNITSGTVYWTVPSSVTTNTFQIATSVANAFVPTPIDTTAGSNTGTQTGTAGAAMANNIAINVTGLALTAGDWDVWGMISWDANAATTWTKLETSISQTSATLATAGAVGGTSYQALFQISAAATNGISTVDIGPAIINVNATTNVFLVVKGAFATNTLGAKGFIMARRRS